MDEHHPIAAVQRHSVAGPVLCAARGRRFAPDGRSTKPNSGLPIAGKTSKSRAQIARTVRRRGSTLVDDRVALLVNRAHAEPRVPELEATLVLDRRHAVRERAVLVRRELQPPGQLDRGLGRRRRCRNGWARELEDVDPADRALDPDAAADAGRWHGAQRRLGSEAILERGRRRAHPPERDQLGGDARSALRRVDALPAAHHAHGGRGGPCEHRRQVDRVADEELEDALEAAPPTEAARAAQRCSSSVVIAPEQPLDAVRDRLTPDLEDEPARAGERSEDRRRRRRERVAVQLPLVGILRSRRGREVERRTRIDHGIPGCTLEERLFGEVLRAAVDDQKGRPVSRASPEQRRLSVARALERQVDERERQVEQVLVPDHLDGRQLPRPAEQVAQLRPDRDHAAQRHVVQRRPGRVPQ